MRRIDAQPLMEAMEARRRVHRLETAPLHALERWRERLMAEGDAALQALFEAHPQADRQRLRLLVRRARAAGDPAAQRRRARELWRALRELIPG